MPRSEPDHLVDAATAALHVTHLRGRPCAPGTIWSWATRGHITRHSRGRYDIREIEHWTRRLIMDELITWLRAQLDEDERVARATLATGHGSWHLDGHGGIRGADGIGIVGGSAHMAPADVAHIARWDPARVLGKIAAERAILDLHHETAEHECDACNERQYGFPCPTVRLLAQPYAGRDGWRAEWLLDAA